VAVSASVALVRLALLVLFGCAHSAPRAPATPELGDALVAAVTARDAHAIAARCAPDAEVAISAGAVLHGRAEIERGVRELFARFAELKVMLGRQWVGGEATVIELVVTGRRAERPIGVAAAMIVRFDAGQRVATARLYIDVPTLVGQIAPERLPAGARTRTPISAPPAGSAVMRAAGSAVEAAHLAAADASWAGLDAHDPAAVLAAAAPAYVYDDASGPAPLDREATRALLERWFGLVPDFKVAREPTHFAAGDDVVIESVEQMTFRGRAVILEGLDIKHFEGDRVTREWQYANGAGVLRALFDVVLEVP
jgi:SnoaL-like protein